MAYYFQPFKTERLIDLGEVNITNYGRYTAQWDGIWKVNSKHFSDNKQIILNLMNLPMKSNHHPLF